MLTNRYWSSWTAKQHHYPDHYKTRRWTMSASVTQLISWISATLINTFFVRIFQWYLMLYPPMNLDYLWPTVANCCALHVILRLINLISIRNSTPVRRDHDRQETTAWMWYFHWKTACCSVGFSMVEQPKVGPRPPGARSTHRWGWRKEGGFGFIKPSDGSLGCSVTGDRPGMVVIVGSQRSL